MSVSVNSLKHQIKIQEDVIEAQSKIITEIQNNLNQKNTQYNIVNNEKMELEKQIVRKQDLLDQYLEQIAFQEKQTQNMESELVKTKLHNAQLQTEINEIKQERIQYQKFMTKMNSVETSSAGSITPQQQFSPTSSMKNFNIFINDNLIQDNQENRVFKNLDFADESQRQSYQKAVQDNKEVFRNSSNAFSDHQDSNSYSQKMDSSNQNTEYNQTRTQLSLDNISFQKQNSKPQITINTDQEQQKIEQNNNQSQENNNTTNQKQLKNSQDEIKISSIIQVIQTNPLLYNDVNNTIQDKQNDEQLKIWNKEIIPLFQICYPDKINKYEKIYPRMKSLIKKFIPQSLRSQIWPFLIGNKLQITRQLYKYIQENYEKNGIPLKIKNLIKEDLNRTYPAIKEFSKGGDIYNNLMQILELWQYYRPDIGYIQGMAYPCAILLLTFNDNYKVFKYFSNLIVCKEFILNLYSFKVEFITIYSKTFESLLKERHPNVYKHLQFHKIQSEVYLIEWFYTLFCRAFSFPIVVKCWDLFLYYGEVAFFKIAVGVFSMIEDKIIELDFDGTLFLIRNSTQKIDQVLMLKTVIDQKMKKEKFEEKLRKQKLLFQEQQQQQQSGSNSNSNNASIVNRSRKVSQASNNSKNSQKGIFK